MHELAQPESKDIISDDIAIALIAPDPPYLPFGANEPLSDYIYRPMRVESTADRMIAFVDTVEKFIQTLGGTDPANEFNEMKIQRMLALVGDIPEEIPDSERLRAIEHVLGLDWVLNNAEIWGVRNFIQDQLNKNSDLDKQLRAIIIELIDKKLAVLLGDPRTSELVSEMSTGKFSVDIAMDTSTAIRKAAPDMAPTCDGLVQLLFLAGSYPGRE